MCAALAGTAILAFFFSGHWPGSHWAVLSRADLVAKGRSVAQSIGVDLRGWNAYVAASVPHPGAGSPAGLSPLAVRITFVPNGSSAKAEVGFDSAGHPLFWRVKHKDDDAKSRATADGKDAAAVAFHILAGADSQSYTGPVKSSGDDDGTQQYRWRRTVPAHSGVEDTITVITAGSSVISAEREAGYQPASGEDEDEDDVGFPSYWGVLGGIFGTLCTAGMLVMIAIYVLWLARKAVSHTFPIRVAGGALVLMTLAMFFGTDWDRRYSLSRHQDLPVIPVLFEAAIIYCFVAVSRGISVTARPKWMTLEQLCRVAPVSKSAGLSVAAGVLFSPLLTAVPFLIAGCCLFGHAVVLPQNAEVLYSRAPMLDSLRVGDLIYLIGAIAFAVPGLQRAIRPRILRVVLVVCAGTVFFADSIRVVSGPITAPLAAGLLTFLLFWMVWDRFDALAIVTLQLASSILLSCCMLASKGAPAWSCWSTLGCLFLLGLWMYWKGAESSEGDASATVPTLVGFRAEREKLQAEFSLARRAQQEMLPPTPPIAGYSVAASCTPSLDVGGDLYDFLTLPDGRVAIGVADVSGKGVPAALYMTLTKGLLASVTKDDIQLVRVVEEVNRHLHSVTRKKVFVTMALGFLDVQARVLECVRAGHNPMVWRRAMQNATTLVSPGGLGLGITAGKVFSTQLKIAQLQLAEGDAVVFYSDGITEAMNADMELFGEERLMEAVAKADNLDAAATLDSILTAVKSFLDGIHPQDDMTLVVLRVGIGGVTVRG